MINKKTIELYKTLTQEQLNKVFIDSCYEGRLEVVKYLLTSPDLKEHADIHAQDDYGFRTACVNGHLEVVKYLLTSPELKEHADIHADNDYGFRLACANGQLEIVKFLILDMSIEKTKHIEDYLNKSQDNKCVKEAIELFKIRQFNQKLNNDLEHKEKKNKLKI